jgi:methylase of polypeptide subunit release factors
MKADRVDAWMCGICNRNLFFTEREAEECCSCPECGGGSGLTGSRALCKLCSATAGVKRSEEALETARENLRLSETVLAAARRWKAKLVKKVRR